MSETTLATLGIIAGVINTLAVIPYLRDIFRRKTKPERATWWIWLMLNVIALFAQIAVDVRWSILLTISSVLTVGSIAVLSIPYGYGTFHRRDTISLIIAFIGVIASVVINSPLLALLVVIAVDVVGVWLTVQKTWIAPHTETLIAWVVAATSSILALLAIGEFEFSLMLYAVYGVLANWTITFVILYRRPKVMRDPKDF